MTDLWRLEAGKYNVLPMPESHMKKTEGYHPKGVLRFAPAKRRTQYTLYPGIIGGGNQSGHALYIRDGRLICHHNRFGYKHLAVKSDKEITDGSHEFTKE